MGEAFFFFFTSKYKDKFHTKTFRLPFNLIKLNSMRLSSVLV